MNYILPVTYSPSFNMKPFEEDAAEHPFELNEVEAKFQISLKFSLMYKVFDDNPDILDYMANFELTDVYGVDEHRFTLMLRNNLSSDKYGAAEATWS